MNHLRDDNSTSQPSSELIVNLLDYISLPKKTPAKDLHIINSPISLKELNNTIHAVPLNKSNGPGGYSTEYYKHFTALPIPHQQKVFHAAASAASFPSEMLLATNMTLPKPGKEPNTPQIFHPISMLNVNVKIYAKIKATRLAHLLPILIKPDQMGLISERPAPDTTRHI